MPVALLALVLFLAQAGFHGYTAALPLALGRAGERESAIGLIVGAAALVQVPAAILGGRLVDRCGGLRLLRVGCAAYVAASAILLVPGVEPGGSPLPFLLARALQGIGIAVTLPGALSLVPGLVAPHRQGSGLAFVGAAQNLTLVLLPPASITILDAASLDHLAVAVALLVTVAFVLAGRVPPGRPRSPAAGPERRGRLGLAWRRSWAIPLAIVAAYIVHWGAVTAYLPVRAAAEPAAVGLFFAADGIAVVLMRIPSGWLADRIATGLLVAAGAAVSAVAVALLLLPPTTPVLVVAGLLGGAGGATVMTPLLVELSRRSDDGDRGSAFALYSAALAAAMALGSIGAAPLVETAGLGAALWAGIASIGIAIVLGLRDPTLRVRRRGTTGGRAPGAADSG